MTDALYGAHGFFSRADGPGGAGGHFRTSATASPQFATAMLRLVAAVDGALGRPDPLDVVDVGAGGGHLLRRLDELARADPGTATLATRLRLRAVEVAPRPAGLPEHIDWLGHLPAPGTVTGVLLATEWLDNVPLDVAQVNDLGALRYVHVVPQTGIEVLGGELAGVDAAWVSRWWGGGALLPGTRVELGGPRDEAWAQAVSTLAAGAAVTVDYGHTCPEDRPAGGTLTGFHAGREVPPVPDGSCDLTAHVAIDAVRAAGEAIAAAAAVLTTQREALRGLGLDGTRPPLDLARNDPAGYVRALSRAGEAAELMDPTGLGAHWWLVQLVAVPPHALPDGLRP